MSEEKVLFQEVIVAEERGASLNFWLDAGCDGRSFLWAFAGRFAQRPALNITRVFAFRQGFPDGGEEEALVQKKTGKWTHKSVILLHEEPRFLDENF